MGIMYQILYLYYFFSPHNNPAIYIKWSPFYEKKNEYSETAVYCPLYCQTDFLASLSLISFSYKTGTVQLCISQTCWED